MVGKRLLPWFGGGPGVWSLCLMFYQSALFLGYAYAHGLIHFISEKWQWVIHAFIVGLTLCLLPVLPGELWRPNATGDPSGAILLMLIANVALPFMALAATGPLLQAWFARSQPHRSPYPLYAVSNLGSMLAVFAFPIAIESRWNLASTSDLWSLGFAGTAIMIVACGLISRKSHQAPPPSGRSAQAHAQTKTDQFLLWLLLPACAVILLMSITNKLCQEIASLPFLWVLPLGLYLLSFILSFSSERLYSRFFYIGLPLLTFALFFFSSSIPFFPSLNLTTSIERVWLTISIYSLVLFALCMILHGELYRLRPPVDELTKFYLSVSGGGALGGIFVGLIAPRIFSTFYEVSVGIGLAIVLTAYCLGRDSKSKIYFRGPRWRIVTVSLVAVFLLGQNCVQTLNESDHTIHRERNFFGVVRVKEVKDETGATQFRTLQHGSTLHGKQLTNPSIARRPLSYYSPFTGIGILLNPRETTKTLHIGVVGLGVGTLSTYGGQSDSFRFYEIDPAVIRIAQDDEYFTYLRDSPSEIKIIPGDARLNLQMELDSKLNQDFDILVIDAFSSDAIPLHLITREAFQLFLDHLNQSGILAVHITSRHFDLLPIIIRIGESLGLEMLSVLYDPGSARQAGLKTRWVFLSPNPEKIQSLTQKVNQQQLRISAVSDASIVVFQPDPNVPQNAPLWTDDYSSLFELLGLSSSSTPSL